MRPGASHQAVLPGSSTGAAPGLRICVLTTRHGARDDRIYYKEAMSLTKRYQPLWIVAPGDVGEPIPDDPRFHFHLLQRRPGLLGRLRMLWDAARVVREIKPDICHFHDLDQLLIVPLLARGGRTRLVYDAHEAYPEAISMSRAIPVPLRTFAGRCTHWLEKTMARRCALTITADEGTAGDFRRVGIPTEVLFNFPPEGVFAGGRVADRPSLERFRGRTVALYHGTMGAERGLFDMLSAVPAVKARIPDYLLLLIGLRPGPLSQEVQARIRQMDIGGSVAIIPWADHLEIPAYLDLATVGLAPLHDLPKYKKNIPLKIFEYMSCGLPVVGSDIPSIAPFIREAESGLVFPPASVPDLAAAVIEVVTDRERRDRMGANGRRAVSQKWNWGMMETRLLEAYAKLAGSPVQEAGPREGRRSAVMGR